jgi:hypothetical protein
MAIGSARLYLPSYYKLEQKIVLLNIFNILQNLFTWNNGMTNILDLKLPTDTYASDDSTMWRDEVGLKCAMCCYGVGGLDAGA